MPTTKLQRIKLVFVFVIPLLSVRSFVYPVSSSLRSLLNSHKMVALMAAGVLKDEPITDPSVPIPRFYPIGTPGVPWTCTEDAEWKSRTKLQRSYQEQVVDKLIASFQSHPHLTLHSYGALSHNPARYPLYVVTSKAFDKNLPTLLVTGGVHGYETSGVQGAILFLEEHAAKYFSKVNIVVAPCISPWAYEHIQRWQADLQDPNRSFVRGTTNQTTTEESRAFMNYLDSLVEKHGISIQVHLDLHETTNTDATEFMPAKHAKAGLAYKGEEIPDGFYLVADSEAEVAHLDFQTAIIQRVKTVTHIAPPDANGDIIEVPLTREGLILVPAKSLGLCCSVTSAKYRTTTEVYPDSPLVTDDICNQAQVAAIEAALDYVLQEHHGKDEL